MSRKKGRKLSKYQRRRLRIQQVVFALFAIIVIVSFVVSLMV